MKKRLVFYFYVGDEDSWDNNEAYRLHLACLNYYSSVFDEAMIVISTDISDKNVIGNIKKAIIENIRIPSITVKIAESTPLRESKTFYDEVVNSDYEGIIFFGHSKGVTNIVNPSYNHDNIVDWILGLYFLSLNYSEEAERCLSFSTSELNSPFFGSFTCVNRDGSFYLPSVYSGTFFWINMRAIRNRFNIEGKELPKMATRMSSEEFPGLCYKEWCLNPGSHAGRRIYYDIYDAYGVYGGKTPRDEIGYLCDGNPEEYDKFKNEMLLRAKVTGN